MGERRIIQFLIIGSLDYIFYMGTWGTGINQNDTASDVVDMCKEIYPVMTPDEADRLITKEYNAFDYEVFDDDDLADFWYAYANWQWDHGVLTEKNKALVLDLLEKQSGMVRWREEGNQSDIRKRLAVMDKLKAKLMCEQPQKKISRPKIDKPKHKPGDIVVFKVRDDSDSNLWTLDKFNDHPLWFDDKYKIPESLSTPYHAKGKYLALLCVGTEKEEYSKYCTNLFHEHSVYAFYDYAEESFPSVEHLSMCGFLPCVFYSYLDFNRHILDSIEWTYTFTTLDKFYSKESSRAADYLIGFEKVERLSSANELERFHKLKSRKNYSDQTNGYFSMGGAFYNFYSEKLRFSEIGVEIDDLLDPCKENPKLVSTDEYQIKLEAWLNRPERLFNRIKKS